MAWSSCIPAFTSPSGLLISGLPFDTRSQWPVQKELTLLRVTASTAFVVTQEHAVNCRRPEVGPKKGKALAAPAKDLCIMLPSKWSCGVFLKSKWWPRCQIQKIPATKPATKGPSTLKVRTHPRILRLLIKPIKPDSCADQRKPQHPWPTLTNFRHLAQNESKAHCRPCFICIQQRSYAKEDHLQDEGDREIDIVRELSSPRPKTGLQRTRCPDNRECMPLQSLHPSVFLNKTLGKTMLGPGTLQEHAVLTTSQFRCTHKLWAALMSLLSLLCSAKRKAASPILIYYQLGDAAAMCQQEGAHGNHLHLRECCQHHRNKRYQCVSYQEQRPVVEAFPSEALE